MKKLSVKLSAQRINKGELKAKSAEVQNCAIWYKEYKLFVDAKKEKELKKELLAVTKLEASTIGNRFRFFKNADKQGLNMDGMTFTKLGKTLTAISKGTKSVSGGVAVDNPTKTAEIQQEKEIIKAANENDLVNMLANEEFKKIMFIIEKQGFELSILQKAIKAASVKV